MKYIYASMVLFLLVLITTTSSVLCRSSSNYNNDEEISMVVEEKTSDLDPGMAQKPFQLGRFNLKGVGMVTLLQPVNGKENCIEPDQPCGLLHHCCEGLMCDGLFNGRCHYNTECRKIGQGCSFVVECCYPDKCNQVLDGKCVKG